jgi:uncharacterized protein (TIGR03067 family)
MKSLLILTFAAVLAIGCSRQDPSGPKGAVPAKEGPGNAQQDQKDLPGTWKVVTIGGNGKTMPPERIGDMKVTISGQQYTTTKSGKLIEQATMTTDPSKQPKTIDLAIMQGEAKGQTLLGIYEITDDTLRIAVSEPGKARPTEIANRAGLRQDVWELRREGMAALAVEDKEKRAEAPKEESVVAYDSKTMGAIQVKVDQKDPVDSFDILQNGERIGKPKILNGTVELAAGDYVVDVNRTQRKVTIEAGKKTILWTGELVVEGKPLTMAWYAMNGKVKLTSNGVEPLLNRASPLFPGTYTVFVDTSLTGQDKSLGHAEVKAGRKTVLKH